MTLILTASFQAVRVQAHSDAFHHLQLTRRTKHSFHIHMIYIKLKQTHNLVYTN